MFSGKNVAVLWDEEVDWKGQRPFNSNRDKDYAFYSNKASGKNINLFLGNYRWYKDGKLAKGYHWDGKNWKKVTDVSLDLVYDKFRYDNDTEKIKKKISDEVGILNDPGLEKLCKDKLKTYRKFSDYVPETELCKTGNVEDLISKHQKAVVKPRYGFGGAGVNILESMSEFEPPESPEKFVVQRFVETEGYDPWNLDGPHDLRTAIIDGELQGGNYVRVPEEGRISNIALGGGMRYVSKDDIPESIIEIVSEVSEALDKYQPAVFSIDFMFDQNEIPWVVELNSKPGIYFHHEEKKKSKEAPKINAIVEILEKKLLGKI